MKEKERGNNRKRKREIENEKTDDNEMLIRNEKEKNTVEWRG